MPRICQLDANVVNKIAAGEVIERPASVVKELLENSIDALATRVDVDVAQGGTELIRVVDDGEGIHPDDLALSVSSHATSKIQSADDLFRVQTLGFRGEALASIAAVSRLRIRSRQPGETNGVELEVNCGQVGRLQPCGCPAGTLIEIRQLFGNTPVRRKFLKTNATEFGHVSEHFTRIALAHPRLHMVLRHNDKVVYELPAADRLLDRLRLFFGSDLTDKLIWVESEAAPIRLWGYVAHPSQSKSTRKGQYLFLNGRRIQDRSLQHALGEAYRGLLMVGRQPIAFLFLEMPAEQVDVNVHPTKAEVRFRDPQQLYRHLLSTLRTRFLGMNLDTALRVPTADESAAAPPDPARQQELQMELATWAQSQLEQRKPSESVGSSLPADSPAARPSGAEPFGESESDRFPEIGVPATRNVPNATPAPHFTAPRAMQIHDCYLVIETEAGLTVIDQHALHERVLYEQLRGRVLAEAVESQRLLVPESIEFSPSEAALLLENRDLLAQLGFGIDDFGKSTILLTRYPVMLARADLVGLIRDIAEQLAGPAQKPNRRDILDGLLHMISCKAAIKSGQRLTPEEMEALLAQRHLVDDAHHCPHGRPTALVLSRDALDRQFGRMG